VTNEELEKISQKYAYYSQTDKLDKNTAVYHVRVLLAEVERLKQLTE